MYNEHWSVYAWTGRVHEAAKAFKDALGAYRSIPDTELDQASCLMNLGAVYKKISRLDEAENALLDALRIYRSHPGQS